MKFGTDGLRGRAGLEITAELALALGRAVVQVLGAHIVAGGGTPRVAIARDTRPSGPMLEAAVAAGVLAAGGEVLRCGVLPTPGLSVVTAQEGCVGGVMITASHNPAPDNGLKVLGPDGRKLSKAMTLAIEAALVAPNVAQVTPAGQNVELAEAADHWLHAVRRGVPGGAWLRGTRLVLDAANGAARGHALRLLRNLGAEVHAIGEGEGSAINEGCGAVHPERMCAEVRAIAADAGIALDGDADRVVLCDANGSIVDGDGILYLLARGPVAVGTVMSNEGLARALHARGTVLQRAAVGDANVADAMTETGATIGAEPSGHVLFRDGLPTGCGLLAGLRALAAARSDRTDGIDLREALTGYMPTFQAHAKAAVAPLEPLAGAIAALEAAGSRVVARKSGTEPIIRVMVEHMDAAQARAGLDTLLGLLGASS